MIVELAEVDAARAYARWLEDRAAGLTCTCAAAAGLHVRAVPCTFERVAPAAAARLAS